MEKAVQNIPFLRFTIALVVGIVAGQFIKVTLFFGSLILLFVLLALFFINLKYRFKLLLPFGLFFNLFFVLSGIVVFNHYNQKPEFYNSGIFVATVLERPVEKPNSYKATVAISNTIINDSLKTTHEKVIVYFEKQESAEKLEAGDEIIFNRAPGMVAPKLNPYDFDYKKYLERKKIYRQVYLASGDWQPTGNTRFSLVCEAERLRAKLIDVYRSQPIDSVEFEILSALTLGYSRELDPETRRVFSSSGAMHVLSVSGLHVAIIFWVLNFLFGFLKKRRHGRFVFALSVIIVLWFYAFITGLSPSVLRATAMFSVYIVGENINRKSNIFNSLALTAFFLLLINPNNLFDIGFQLSYCALFGIVVIEPKLSEKLVVKNRILRYFVSAFTVSVAAQIATFPLTSFYFSQFPVYFWLTNIFIIPAVAFLTPAGIALLFFSHFPVIPDLISFVLNFVLKGCFYLLSAIDQFPFSVFPVTVNGLQLVLIIFVIISLFLVINQFSARNLKFALIVIFGISISVFATRLTRQNTSELFVYHSTSGPIIHLIEGRENIVITEESTAPEDLQYSPFSATQKALGLRNPLFFLAGDTVSNKHFSLKNRKLLFRGQTIYLGGYHGELHSETGETVLINPRAEMLLTTHPSTSTVILTNKRFLPEKVTEKSQIYCTFEKGAFQKIW